MSPRAKGLARARSAPPVLSKLRELYSPAEWALLTEVRSEAGTTETIRSADALAVYLWGGEWTVHGFEAKASRADWLREIKRPEKSGPLKLYCSAWFLVVAAPWKNILLSTTELPDRWGLIEVGTGLPTVVVKPQERRAEEPTLGFFRSLLRAATRDGADEALAQVAPRVAITRPFLSKQHVGLACNHVAPRPFSKVMPQSTLCFACAEGRPADRLLVEQVIDEASAEDLALFADMIERRSQARAA